MMAVVISIFSDPKKMEISMIVLLKNLRANLMLMKWLSSTNLKKMIRNLNRLPAKFVELSMV